MGYSLGRFVRFCYSALIVRCLRHPKFVPSPYVPLSPTYNTLSAPAVHHTFPHTLSLSSPTRIPNMSPLAITFSQVFDYKAYEGEISNEASRDHHEKLRVSEEAEPNVLMSPGLGPSLDLRPLHDVQNVVSHDDMAANGAFRQPPFAHLHDDEENTPFRPATLIRRESTHKVLDLSWPTAGPSRSASQRLARELERMTSDFGSEFDGEDAVIYGGSVRGEGSFVSDSHGEDEDEEIDAESSCSEDTVMMDCDDDSASDTSESHCSTAASLSELDEEPMSDDDSQGGEGDSDDDMESCNELPEDVPTPAALEDVSLSIRRSARDRRAATPCAPPAAPGKGKGKGKATASKVLSPSTGRSATPKRARSPSPPGHPARHVCAGKRPRLRPVATQALLVSEDEDSMVECAVAESVRTTPRRRRTRTPSCA
ncbi:hypothetical protein LXA43DRAFT_28016 [Ganoderma leucocontextum]|nr:hypothetical protein LXA43DRAFT_28016 [Ganoderma leucocontextum]